MVTTALDTVSDRDAATTARSITVHSTTMVSMSATAAEVTLLLVSGRSAIRRPLSGHPRANLSCAVGLSPRVVSSPALPTMATRTSLSEPGLLTCSARSSLSRASLLTATVMAPRATEPLAMASTATDVMVHITLAAMAAMIIVARFHVAMASTENLGMVRAMAPTVASATEAPTTPTAGTPDLAPTLVLLAGMAAMSVTTVPPTATCSRTVAPSASLLCVTTVLAPVA